MSRRDAELPKPPLDPQVMLAAIVESSDDAIISKDLNGIVTSWNQSAERIYGYTAAEMIGQPIFKLIPPERPNEEPAILERLRRGERVDHFETIRVRKDGRRINVSVSISPVRNPEGQIIGASKVARDVTEQKRLEAELQARTEEIALRNAELLAKNQELELADQQKNEFLAMLAHELRNPLAPIVNSVHFLQARHGADPVLRRHHAMIDRQVRHMARLLEDLLDVSRITHRRVKLRTELIDLGEVVSQAVEALKAPIAERQQELSLTAPAEALPVEGDVIRLTQVVTNLVNNAAKFTEAGGRIEVRLERAEQDAVLRVRDTGVGIAPELLPQVFDLFTQADQDLARTMGGLGIGLTIVKSLVELHGGSIEAHSEGTGHGAEFVVRLPLATEAKPATERESGRSGAAAGSERCRVLVVDDNEDGAESLAELVRAWDCDACTAPDGPTALRLATEYRPHVVFLDIGMPGMDGYEVARALRAGPADPALLVALTGYGQDEDRERAREAGFDRHLTKPVDPKTLRELLSACAEGSSLSTVR